MSDVDGSSRRYEVCFLPTADIVSLTAYVRKVPITEVACITLDDLLKQTGGIGSGYSITSSAMASILSGICTPSALAVLRLTTRSNLIGCSIGISPGFAPFRILST